MSSTSRLFSPRIFLLLALAGSVCAQARFADLGKRHLPHDGARTSQVAIADLNGDGQLDIVTSGVAAGGGSSEVRLYVQVDKAVFAPIGAPIVVLGALTSPPVLADFDGDGDLDLILASAAVAASELYENDGTGVFTRAPGALPIFGGGAMAVGDVDGDGDLDLAVSSFRSPTKLWLNDGAGVFTDVTASQMPFSGFNNTTLAFIDVDQDSDLDLFVGNSTYYIGHLVFPGPNQLFLNVGLGVFIDASGSLPGQVPDNTLHVSVADADGDQWPDLAFAETLGTRLLLNNRLGAFTDASTRLPPGAERAAGLLWVDVDGDLDQDLVLSGAPTRIYRNDSAANFVDVSTTHIPSELGLTGSFAAADVDRDGDVDLVLTAEEQNKLLLNPGDGVFVDATRPQLAPSSPSPQVLGDVDGDGDLDLVLGSPTCCSRPGGLLFLNDGDGGFSPRALPAETEEMLGPLQLIDVDRDGDLDLLFLAMRANPRSMRLRLYSNDGVGGFTDATAGRFPSLAAEPRTMCAGDVDGDGDPDLILAFSPGVDQLYLNDGAGRFSASTGLPQVGGHTNALALGDVDGDLDNDLVLGQADYANFQNRTRLLLNDGSGVFSDATATHMPTVASLTNDVELGDVDGDGALDIVLGSWGSASYPNERHRVFLNDGAGRFRDATSGLLASATAGTYDAHLVDVDDDGDLDLFTGFDAVGEKLLLNDGRGTFVDAAMVFSARPTSPWSYASGDIDGDGDVDLLRAGSLLTNLHRQSHAPQVARLNASYRYDFYSQPGYGTGAHVAVPFLAFARANLPVPPFGVLRLDPATRVSLPIVPLPQPFGTGSLAFHFPDRPALVGLPFFLQALIVPSNPFDARLSNVSSDRARRL